MLLPRPFSQEINAMLDHLFVFVIALDSAGRIVDVNQSFMDCCKLEKASFLNCYLSGISCRDFILP